jgi:MFS family permease
LAGQFGDGVFQASLAGAVLFNPERQAHPADLAAGFAVVLLPYSFIGPFAGVLLDRWSRQRTLLIANVVRAVLVAGVAVEVMLGVAGIGFYASALVVISVNRFVLAALSSGLPHVVDAPTLVGANALSTTSGGIAATIGGASTIGLHTLFDAGGGNAGYGVFAVCAAAPYLLAAAAATRFRRGALGPDAIARESRQTALDILLGMVAGARHIAQRRPVYLALIAIGVHRFGYGIVTVSTLLLYRNYFQDEGALRAGLAGLGQVVVCVAIGAGLAAVLTPALSRRFGLVRYASTVLMLAAVAQIGLALLFKLWSILLLAFLLGYAAQGVKICVDTTVQGGIEDPFRGRVFSLYDTLFNLTFVAAACTTAVLLPDTGKSLVAFTCVGLGWLITGLVWGTRKGSTPKLATDLPAAPTP